MKPKSKFKKGDFVSVINDTLAGEVIAINDGRITFECDEGFSYSFNADELVYRKEWSDLILQPDKNDLDSSDKRKRKTSDKRKSEALNEVDLHIHQLISNESGMSNYDKLSLQLNTAKNALETAIEKKQQKIIFIHGRGEGVLRKKLRDLLRKYPVDFHDASYATYGIGATQVIIFQNKK